MNNHNNTKECCYVTDSTDTLFDCIIPYIHPNDLKSVSLTSRKLYELDNIPRKRVTLRKGLKRLECVRVKRMIAFDKDLDRLASMSGDRITDFKTCTGFTIDGLLCVGKKCSELRVLSLNKSWSFKRTGSGCVS
ncbi:coronatine-insensitive protein 1-like protein [Tanacetum coccineum]